MLPRIIVSALTALTLSVSMAVGVFSAPIAKAVEYDLEDPVFTLADVQPSSLNQDEDNVLSFMIEVQDESGIGSISFSCRSTDSRFLPGPSIRIQVGLTKPTRFSTEDGLISNVEVEGNRNSKVLSVNFDLELTKPIPAADYNCLLGAMDRSNYKRTNYGSTRVELDVPESNQLAFRQANTKLNAGSFKGYVALYAKGYEGHKLSAKVGRDWVIVDSIESDFERYVEFTGAGYEINVRMFIDGQFVFSKKLTTR